MVGAYQKWKWKVSLIRKTTMVPKGLTYGMSTELPQHAPKWKSANHGLESSNDEVGIIKRSRDECMKNKY